MHLKLLQIISCPTLASVESVSVSEDLMLFYLSFNIVSSLSFCIYQNHLRGGEMVPPVKTLATKLDDPSLIFGNHMVKEEN